MRTGNSRGIALVSVLTIIVVLGILAGLVGSHAGATLSRNNEASAKEKAYFVAHGALQRGLIELRQDPDYPGCGGSPGAFPGTPGAEYMITVFDNTTPVAIRTSAGIDCPPNTKLVFGEGWVGGKYKAAAGIIAIADVGSNDFAILTKSQLISEGGTIDAFSSAGSFDVRSLIPQPDKANIGSLNSPAQLVEHPTKFIPTKVDGKVASKNVDGDISTADPAGYALDAPSTLKGETNLSTDPIFTASPPVTYLGGPDKKYSSGTKTMWPGHYNSIHLEAATKVIMEPGDYYVKENFEAWEDVKIYCPNGKVTLHVDGLLATGQNATLNTDGDPRELEVVLTGNRPKFEWLPWSYNLSQASPWKPGGVPYHLAVGGTSKVWGEVKAPEGGVHVSGDVYGRVRADKLAVYGDPDGSGGVHYFTDLASVTSRTGAKYVYDSVWTVR